MPRRAENPEHRKYFYPVEPPADLANHATWDTVCVPVPVPLLPYLPNLLAVYRWEGRVKHPDPAIRALFVEIWNDLISRFVTAESCLELSMGTLLRQNPANQCELQQSTDGQSWVLAFDFSRCQPKSSTTENYNTYNDIQNTVNNYNQTWNNNPGVPNFAPTTVYDGGNTANDQKRDKALCQAVSVLFETIVGLHREALENPQGRPVFEIVASLGFAIIGGLAAASFSGGVAAPVAVSAIVGAVSNAATQLGYNFSASVQADGMMSVKTDVTCCIYNALKGATVTQSAFQAAASSCGFPAGTAADTATVVSQYLQSQDVYLSFLKFVEDAYGIASLGIELPPCPCHCMTTSTQTYDFVPVLDQALTVETFAGISGEFVVLDAPYRVTLTFAAPTQVKELRIHVARFSSEPTYAVTLAGTVYQIDMSAVPGNGASGMGVLILPAAVEVSSIIFESAPPYWGYIQVAVCDA